MLRSARSVDQSVHLELRKAVVHALMDQLGYLDREPAHQVVLAEKHDQFLCASTANRNSPGSRVATHPAA
ncbi:hypothetical protein EF294_02025 [Gordonia oryzae]|uniref:Uncharacterized protein n=1 Tax=Gordonia oryzae TaxID=2487349 RepID=A0A3N4GVU9_9ACTN|nr:hypothetical protein EF294_02025 [Gordonia oryzae]